MKNNMKKVFFIAIMLPVLTLACSLSIPTDISDLPSPVNTTPAITAPTPTVESAPVKISLPPISTGEEMTLTELYVRINPAVVNIITYTKQDNQVAPSGQGSGFVYDSGGHIITNAHVVHGSYEVEVVFSDGTIESADVVGEDLHSDLAVVEVVSYPEGVQPIPLGSITDVVVGQTVVAIGNPFGLGGTLTEGIVSALGRTIPALTPFSIPESIQTDAAINPGNSGGPLLNLRGQVIGVNAQIETTGFDRSNSGVGFAIPVSIIKRVVPELIEDGEYEWAWLGVIGGDLSPTLAEVMNLPVEHGAYISQIANDGPAERAGLFGTDDSTIFNSRQLDIGGDVITAVDGQPIGSFGELLIYIALKVTPGQDVTLTVLRDGEYQDIVVNMRERPDSLDSSFQLPTP
jgi:2-alkenal reductase